MNEYDENELPEDYLLYYDGWEAYLKGDYEKAYDLLLKSVDLREHAKTYERLSSVLAALGKPDEAFVYVEKAHKMNPKNKESATHYAQALVNQGRIEEAKTILVATLEHSHNFGPAKKLLNQLTASK